MKSKEVLKLLKVTRPTLTRYVREGKIKVTELPNGQYNYDEDSVLAMAGLAAQRKCVIYARVSTQNQKNDLANQVETLSRFAVSNGYVIDTIYRDIASGLIYDRGEFKKLLEDVLHYRIKVVIIENKDRLTRISFDMWKDLFKEFQCEIIVANAPENEDTEEKEIFSDIISLLQCFSMRMYSQRRKRKIELVSEDLKNEISL